MCEYIITSDKEFFNSIGAEETCTILPLTSERMNDTRWYHIDLENHNSTVLVEQHKNIIKLIINIVIQYLYTAFNSNPAKDFKIFG